MSVLPKTKIPTYTLTVPSTGEEIKYRPFIVKEEKMLLMAKESGDEKEMIDAINSIVNGCTFEKINSETSPIFDLEFIFIKIRSKSVNNISKIKMECTNMVELPKDFDHPAGVEAEKKECGNDIIFEIDLDSIKVSFPEGHSKSVVLDEETGIGISFKYPSMSMYGIYKDIEGEFTTNQIIPLIDFIFDKDNVYQASTVSKEDLIEFIDGLTRDQYKKILKDFFSTIPTLKHTEKYKCSKCKIEGEYTFQGIADFF